MESKIQMNFIKNKYQNHDDCSFIYRLVCVDDKMLFTSLALTSLKKVYIVVA